MMNMMVIKEMDSKVKIEKLCYLFLIFLTGCFIGWMYEEIFYWITEGMLRNRGVLYGPWLPIYGIGALGIYAMKPLKKNPFVLFMGCALITGVVEYIIGYIGIYYLDMRLWDYRGLFLNFDGIICFRSIVSFAVMGVVFHYFLEPVTERVVGEISKNVLHIMCFALLFVFIIDIIFSVLYRTPIMY